MKQSSSFSRRTFLRRAGTAATVACVQPMSAMFAATEAPRWRTAIRDMHLKQTQAPSCWEALKLLEVNAIESVVNENLVCLGLHRPELVYRVDTKDGCKALAEELERQGVTITAFAMSNRLDERLEQELDWMRQLAKAAEQLKVRAIRIDVVPRRLARDQFLPFAVQACRRLCEVIKDSPLVLGIENHGEFTNDPVLLEQLFDGVHSDQLGLTMDIMNFYWYGLPLEDVYRVAEKFASRVFHTHCKNLQYPADRRNSRRPIGWEYDQYAAPLDIGDIDYRRVAAILRQAHYRGDLCLENECLGHFPKEEHVSVLKRELALLKAVS